MTAYVDCPLCGNEIEAEVSPGEPQTWDYPGSGPEVEITAGCECLDSPFVRTDKLEEYLRERLMEKAADFDPMDDGDAAYEAARDEGRL